MRYRWLRIDWPTIWVPPNPYAPPVTPPMRGYRWVRAEGVLPAWTGGIAWRQAPITVPVCVIDEDGCWNQGVCVEKGHCFAGRLRDWLDAVTEPVTLGAGWRSREQQVELYNRYKDRGESWTAAEWAAEEAKREGHL